MLSVHDVVLSGSAHVPSKRSLFSAGISHVGRGRGRAGKGTATVGQHRMFGALVFGGYAGLAACAVAFGLGYVGSVPLAGPIALMVLSRAARRKFGEAFQIGVGAAVAEGLYAGFAFWSVTAFAHRSALLLPLARGATALVLVPLGLYFVFSRSAEPSRADGQEEGRSGTALLGFTVSALNPTLFLTWSAAVGFLLSRQPQSLWEWNAIPFGVSAGAGVASWFLTLVLVLRRYEGKVRRDVLSRVVRGLGVTLFFMGVWSAVRLACSFARARM